MLLMVLTLLALPFVAETSNFPYFLPRNESAVCAPLMHTTCRGDPSTVDDHTTTTTLPLEGYVWTPAVRHLAGLFKAYEHEVRVVGGAVRGIFFNTTPNDIDMITTATIPEILQILEAAGIAHCSRGSLSVSSVRFLLDDLVFEFFSLFKIKNPLGDQISVCEYGEEQESMTPLESTCSFKEDAARRDLTINAMSLDAEGRLYDYFSGREHVALKKMKFPRDDLPRFDILSILRYFRFSDLVNIECPEEYKALFSEKMSCPCMVDPTLSVGAAIWKTFRRILLSSRWCEILDAMEECNVLLPLGLPPVNTSYCNLNMSASDADLASDPSDVIDSPAAVVLGRIFKGEVEALKRLWDRWHVTATVKDTSIMIATNFNISNSEL